MTDLSKKNEHIQRLRISIKIHTTFLLSNHYRREVQINMILCRKVRWKFKIFFLNAKEVQVLSLLLHNKGKFKFFFYQKRKLKFFFT